MFVGESCTAARAVCVSLLASVYRAASFLQRIVAGAVHSREFRVAVMERLDAAGMLDQRVVALPHAMWQLMQLHFDFDAFVDGLNHGASLLGEEHERGLHLVGGVMVAGTVRGFDSGDERAPCFVIAREAR